MISTEGMKFSKDHEWVKAEGKKARVGITDFAQKSLGEIVFVELPEMDLVLGAGEPVGVVESVKAASDILCPVSGRVVETNEELADNPGLLNENPYESWIAVLELSDPAELDDLMDEEAYEAFCREGH